MPIESRDRQNEKAPRRQGTFEIYCDDSGFTGPDLLDPAQPYFTYAAVEVSEGEAVRLLDGLRSEFGVRGEFKASKLVTYHRGRGAMTRIVEQMASRTFLTFHDKRYALACKFFEYVFEPLLEPNSAFYNIGFHKFIANLIYLEVLAAPRPAQEWLLSFQKFFRTADRAHLDRVSEGPSTYEVESILGDIVTFTHLNQETIANEIDSLRSVFGQGNPWALDLTGSSLYEVLRSHGEELEALSVVCDDSHAVAASQSFFEAFVGRTDRPTVKVGRFERQLTFNLCAPIRLCSSGSSAGIQIADILAGALNHGLQNEREEHSQRWLKWLIPRALSGSSSPELERVDLDRNKTRFHRIMLRELVRRSAEGRLQDSWAPFLYSLAQSNQDVDFDSFLEE